LTGPQLGKWREMTGPAMKGSFTAFPGPIAPPAPKKEPKRIPKATP
jgi:hypothetical protein